MPANDPRLEERLAELAASGTQAQGWNPATLAAGWLGPLTLAGVPFLAPGANGGEPWDAKVDPAALRPYLSPRDELYLPPLERFSALTSLPLKPLREWVRFRFGVRLQTGVGVQLQLWANQLVLANRTAVYRGGFLHGPQRGMRTVVALDPGQCQHVVF